MDANQDQEEASEATGYKAEGAEEQEDKRDSSEGDVRSKLEGVSGRRSNRTA